MALALIVLDEAARAIPKSVTLTLPSVEMMMFCGFTSRWMMPWAWAAARPIQTWIAMLVASRTESLPFLPMYSFSVMPSTSSMTM